MTGTSDLFSSGGVQVRMEGIVKHYHTEAGAVEAALTESATAAT